MKRFDITVDGHYPSKSDREYSSSGEFVDAEIAEELLEALEDIVGADVWQKDAPFLVNAKKAIAKAKGE